jgi:hypothetical protein
MIDEDRVDEILQRILKAIEPVQGPAEFNNIITALKDAISFQMALACPICRKRLASELSRDVPEILNRANQFGPGGTCNLH